MHTCTRVRALSVTAGNSSPGYAVVAQWEEGINQEKAQMEGKLACACALIHLHKCAVIYTQGENHRLL